MKLVAQVPRSRPACFVLIARATGLTVYPQLETWIWRQSLRCPELVHPVKTDMCLGAGPQEANGEFSVDIRELLYLTCGIVVYTPHSNAPKNSGALYGAHQGRQKLLPRTIVADLPTSFDLLFSPF